MNYVSLNKGGDMKFTLKLLIFFGVIVFVHVGLVQESIGLSYKEIFSKAEQGHADTQNKLGLMYFHGKGVPKDYEQAYAWFTKAAEQGHTNAQSNLGLMYYTGEGIPKDYIQAYAWWNIAASQKPQSYSIKMDLYNVFREMSSSQIEDGQKLSRELYEKIYNKAK